MWKSAHAIMTLLVVALLTIAFSLTMPVHAQDAQEGLLAVVAQQQATPEPTEEPVEEATAAPVEEATPVPTEEPVEEATPEPVEEATAAPMEEATEEPAEEPAEMPKTGVGSGAGSMWPVLVAMILAVVTLGWLDRKRKISG